MLCQLLAEGGAQEGGFDQLLGGAAALLLEREQVDPLFELADAEDDQRLLDRLCAVAQGEISRVDQLHEREGERDVAGDDLGDLLHIRLVTRNGNHQLEEVALHVVHPVHLGGGLLGNTGALCKFAGQLLRKVAGGRGVYLVGNHLFAEAVRDVHNIFQRGFGEQTVAHPAEIDLDIIHRVHDAEIARGEFKVPDGEFIPLLLVAVDHLLRHRMDDRVVLDLDDQAVGREHLRDVLHQQIRGKGQERCLPAEEALAA